MDILSLLGILFGLFAIFGGAALEGLHMGSIMVPTAAMIVFGGTLGAVLLQSSAEEVKAAKQMLPLVFKEVKRDLRGLVDDILRLSKIARRDGMLALEAKLQEVRDPYLLKALGLLVDGVSSAELRSRLEIAVAKEEEKYQNAARVFEAGGGYAPTIGILGAVLGLIHVMQSLDDPSKLGGGIAVAFVATIYGVGLANLIMLPLAGKLKARARSEAAAAEVVLEGVVGMADGQPTSALEQTLNLMVGDDGEAKKEPAGEPATQPA